MYQPYNFSLQKNIICIKDVKDRASRFSLSFFRHQIIIIIIRKQDQEKMFMKRYVQTLDKLIIQTSCQRSAPYTNLYTLTKRCYWLDSKIFSQSEFRNLSTPIKQPIECIQIQTGSLVLILVYIFICLMFIPMLDKSLQCLYLVVVVYHLCNDITTTKVMSCGN